VNDDNPGSIPNMRSQPVAPATWLKRIAFVSPLVVFLLVYAPVVGRGFISDDFGWIVQSRGLSRGCEGVRLHFLAGCLVLSHQ
jgi:hypothetical protein